MADKEKKIKKKKAKEEEAPAPAPEPAPAPAPAPTRQSSKGGSSRKAKRSGSNVFSMFSQKQVSEFKEAFALMDHDKDGILSKNDLRATFDSLGRLATEKELDEMVNEAPGPINFTQLLSLFAARLSSGSGVTDDDDVVIAAFKTFDEEGWINSEKLKHALCTWGEKFSEKEVNDAFDQMDMDDEGNIDTAKLISMLTAAGGEDDGGAA